MKKDIKLTREKYYVFKGFNRENAFYLGIFYALSPEEAAIDAHLEYSGYEFFQEIIQRDGFYQICHYNATLPRPDIEDPSKLLPGFHLNPAPCNNWYTSDSYIVLDHPPPVDYKFFAVKIAFSNTFRHCLTLAQEIIFSIKNGISLCLQQSFLDYEKYNHKSLLRKHRIFK